MTVALGATVRASRLAMGAVVGVTVVTEDPAEAERAFAVAYAAIEAGEARMSEWRAGSLASRLGAGEAVEVGEGEEVLVFAEALKTRTDGAFDVLWRHPGARLWKEGAVWRADAALDLGGLLKGWLNDRAAGALRAAGFRDFLVDSAGDLYAAGNAEGELGWSVEVWGERALARVRLSDMALSTSGNAGQPGHVHDARTGASVFGDRVVSVVAPTGLVADGLATALYAGGWRPGLVESYGAWAMDGAHRSRGARRVFGRVR